MSSRKIRDKRAKAIQMLRDTGMTDAEIEEQLGHSIEEEKVLEAEFAPAANRTPTQAQVMSSSKEVERWTGESNDAVIDVEVVDIEEDPSTSPLMNKAETPAISLPAVIPALRAPRWSEEWWEQASPAVQSRRCKAHKKTGERCLKAAIEGATVCRVHGGAAPHVKAAARARLDNAADRMAANLLRLGEQAESETVQLSATNSALDRAGITKPTQVELGPMEPKPWEELFEGITTESREQSRARRGYSPHYGTSQFDAAVPPGDPATEQEQDNEIQDRANSAGNGSGDQSSNPPTQGEGHYAGRPSSDGRMDTPHPADQRVRASEPIQWDRGSTGHDGPGAYGAGYGDESGSRDSGFGPARSDPTSWRDAPSDSPDGRDSRERRTGSPGQGRPRQNRPERPAEFVRLDPESGEGMTADEAVLYAARRANERIGAYDEQRAIESGHRRYTAHRKRSIY
ncbi:hypothetical protein [Mycolicibacterium sp. GESEQ-9]|uniref:hypothetical protein n=1 Tax=Mycolicibacterium sp. GESEQ-9 TaxID=2812656 RepID=UPI001B33F832|nr:hypothetical protein [Mycolicibacterium sp. GESEQ-9]